MHSPLNCPGHQPSTDLTETSATKESTNLLQYKRCFFFSFSEMTNDASKMAYANPCYPSDPIHA